MCFAHLLALYTARGYDIALHVNPDKRPIFRANAVTLLEDQADTIKVDWSEGLQLERLVEDHFWLCNKPATNFSRFPMELPDDPRALWEELCRVRVDLLPTIAESVKAAVAAFVATLPRPLILLHTVGNSFQKNKSLRPEKTVELYRTLLARTDGTLLLLDWDNRVPRCSSYRVRHLLDDWKRPGTEELLCLIAAADLLIGIDSGPLHATRFTDTPALGLFEHKYHHPVRMMLPRARQVNLFPKMPELFPVDLRARLAFNIVSYDGPPEIPAPVIADYALKLLEKPRYLDAPRAGLDAVLQQFVLDYERGFPKASCFVDRDRSFDLVFQILKDFDHPVMVETGCIRAEEDWRGAGYSTYLLGAFCEAIGGEFFSVDHSAAHVAFARGKTKTFTRMTITEQDSVSYLAAFDRPIDFLLIDSMDTTVPGAADHALREIQAAYDKLSSRAVVVFDDSYYEKRQFVGKGELAIPWLLEKGWRILYSGYQTVLRAR